MKIQESHRLSILNKAAYLYFYPIEVQTAIMYDAYYK